ncbi:hypothetical protein Trydic_g4172 [Trypoxylus dichotomus]
MPLSIKQHIKRRYSFARDHENWPTAKWRNILWSGKSKIVLFGSSDHRSYLIKPLNNTTYQPQCTLKTVKHGGAKIMVGGTLLIIVQGLYGGLKASSSRWVCRNTRECYAALY